MPDGGTSFLTWLVADSSALVRGAGGDAAVADVTPAQVDDALAALERGDIEYVGLHEGEAFLQVAGAGAGPYVIELHPGPPGFPVHVPAGVTAEAVRFALHGFLTAHPTWAQAFPWEPLDPPAAPPPAGRRRRFFGRG